MDSTTTEQTDLLKKATDAILENKKLKDDVADMRQPAALASVICVSGRSVSEGNPPNVGSGGPLRGIAGVRGWTKKAGSRA